MHLRKIILLIGLVSSYHLYDPVPPPIKMCRMCKHFIPPEGETPDLMKGKCRLFYEINPVTGEYIQSFAIHSRLRNEECGVSGNYYELNKEASVLSKIRGRIKKWIQSIFFRPE